jgi:hypothetical protein
MCGSLPLILFAVGWSCVVAAADDAKDTAKTAAVVSAISSSDPVFVGAGDIASCDDLSGAYATAKLIKKIPWTVFAVGDLAYPGGTDEDFNNCYGPTWGRFKDRTRPAPGNHEYKSIGASGYVHYFGAAAGDPKKEYYSFDLGQWHIISLNSECAQVGGCDKTSDQAKWLQQDLAHHPLGAPLPTFNVPCSARDWRMAPIRSCSLFGTFCITRALTLWSTVTITIMSDSLRKIRTARPILTMEFGSSWLGAGGKIHIGCLGCLNPTAR